MKIEQTPLPGVLVLEPRVFGDARGRFYEAWHVDHYRDAGLPETWMQDNVVHSVRGVLRGMHLQNPNGQHKLVSVVHGSVFDVAVDVRRGSPHFGKWFGTVLSAENHRQLSVPPWFAHGYLVLSDTAVVTYKVSTRYDPATELSIRWNDPDVGIQWPEQPSIVAPRDSNAPTLRDVPKDRLPMFE